MINIKYIYIAIITFLVAFGGLVYTQPAEASVPQAPEYICHATPPDTAANGWNQISPSLLQLVSQGHRFQHDADIIPPYQGLTGWYSGKNWTDEGQAIWRNDCEVPEPPKEECPDGTHEVPYEHEEVYLLDWQEYELVCEPDEPEGNGGTPPTFASSSTEAPSCPNGNTVKLPANVFVTRDGSSATVNGFITEGDSVNIYWRESSEANWTHAVSNIKPNGDNFVSYTIHDLKAGVDYDFGFQQKTGCGGGELVTAFVHDADAPVVFRVSSYAL